MRRFWLALLALLAAGAAYAGNETSGAPLTTRASDTLRRMFRQPGFFGPPPFATASLPTCTATLSGAIIWDTTTLSLKACASGAWSGVGGITSGSTPVTGCQNLVPYGNNSNVLECEAALGYNTATNTLTVPTITITADSSINSGFFFDINGRLRLVSSQLFENANQTPDGLVLGVGATSESFHIYEVGDVAFDFQNGRAGTAATADPSLIIHSRNQSTTQYLQISSQNATGMAELQTNLASLTLGGSKTAITEASAVSIIRVGIPTSTNVYGMNVDYTVYDIAAPNYVVRTGSVKVQGGNASGTATCTINTGQDQETEDGSQIATSNAATLTYTWTNAATTTNCDLQINAASSEGANTFAITWTARVTGNSSSVTVTPQ